MARARKLPLPHSEEAERAVLGALLLEPIHLARVRTFLRPEDWYVDRHRVLYQAFLDVADAGATPDVLTLQAHLDQAGTLAAVGGLAWLATLDLDLPDIGRLDEYAEIVRERSVRRALIAEAKKAILGTVETARPVTELLAALRDTADHLLSRAARVRWEDAGQILDRLVLTLEDGPPAALRGLTTGYPALDRLGPGLLRGGLYVLAGRPGMGKTSLALDITRHVAVELKQPVGVFSLEMRADELGLKLLTAESDIAARYTRAGCISGPQWQILYAAVRRIAGARLSLDDTAGLVLRDLEARSWWLKAQHPDLALLVVDYLQLVTAGVKVDQRRLEIALITRKLKELAGQLDLPVLVLSQLNRELTRRSDPRPQLADLAESGAIEQDADQVAFIHRPEIYAPDDHALRGLA
ncbi:MAG TPA: DnaB-like helicase C-terminal domain-containing protein, partial [Thermoanaerobaculia bacterium]|nr:DnaB-like helicase C-terminal domain-containing protein [Thermoanaerobaculia bacterium]